MAGNFTETSQDIFLVDGRYLEAQCVNDFGEWVRSSLDLDSCIGNINGWLAWDSCGFYESAIDVALVEGGRKLEARLIRADGSPSDYQGIYLNERISNQNGRLTCLPSLGLRGGVRGALAYEANKIRNDIAYEEGRVLGRVRPFEGEIQYEQDRIRNDLAYDDARVRGDIVYVEERVLGGIRPFEGEIEYVEDRVRGDIAYEEDRIRNNIAYDEDRVIGGIEYEEDILRNDLDFRPEIEVIRY